MYLEEEYLADSAVVAGQLDYVDYRQTFYQRTGLTMTCPKIILPSFPTSECSFLEQCEDVSDLLVNNGVLDEGNSAVFIHACNGRKAYIKYFCSNNDFCVRQQQ